MTEQQQHTQDRASRVAVAVLQVLLRRLAQRDLRAEIERLLRDEFADTERQVLSDTRLSDP